MVVVRHQCYVITRYITSAHQSRQEWEEIREDVSSRSELLCRAVHPATTAAAWASCGLPLQPGFHKVILTAVFNVGHQGAAALHVVLYKWVVSTFHKPILGLTKSWAEGQLSSCNVPFHKQSYSLFHLLPCNPHSHLPLTVKLSEVFHTVSPAAHKGEQ